MRRQSRLNESNNPRNYKDSLNARKKNYEKIHTYIHTETYANKPAQAQMCKDKNTDSQTETTLAN